MKMMSIGILIIALIFFLNSCGIENEVPEKYQSIMRATGAALGEMEEQYELDISRIGFSVEHETGNHLIRKINISLNTKKFIKKDEARVIIVKFTSHFTKNVNNINEIENYLHKLPYSLKDVDIIIFLGKYQDPVKPYIKSVNLRGGNVTYETVEPGVDHQPIYERETIEEALRIVHKETCEGPR